MAKTRKNFGSALLDVLSDSLEADKTQLTEKIKPKTQPATPDASSKNSEEKAILAELQNTKRERKSERVQLVLTPSFHAEVKAGARKMRTSINDFANIALRLLLKTTQDK